MATVSEGDMIVAIQVQLNLRFSLNDEIHDLLRRLAEADTTTVEEILCYALQKVYPEFFPDNSVVEVHTTSEEKR